VQPPVTTSRRLDAIDAERFEEMLASESFALLRARIAAELERARTDCESQPELRDIHRAQGAAKALRMTLDLPARMLTTMKDRK
jgi:hypothetical protein